MSPEDYAAREYLDNLLEILDQAFGQEMPFDGQSSDSSWASESDAKRLQDDYMRGYLGLLLDDATRTPWLTYLNETGILSDRKVKPLVEKFAKMGDAAKVQLWGELIRRIHWAVYERTEKELRRLRPPQELRPFHDVLVKNVRAYVLLCGGRGESGQPYKPLLRDAFAWPNWSELMSRVNELESVSSRLATDLKDRLYDYPVFEREFEEADELERDIAGSVGKALRNEPDIGDKRRYRKITPRRKQRGKR